MGIESSSGDSSLKSCIASKEDPPLLMRYTIFKNSKRLTFPLFKGRTSVMKSSNVIPRSVLLFLIASRNNVNFAEILFAISIYIISPLLTIISLVKNIHIKLPSLIIGRISYIEAVLVFLFSRIRNTLSTENSRNPCTKCGSPTSFTYRITSGVWA